MIPKQLVSSASFYYVKTSAYNLLFTGAFGFERNEHLKGRIVTTTRSHSDYTITKTVEACEPDEVLRVGGAGHKVWTFYW